MADFKLESWEREPLWLKLITPFLKKKRFPALPEQPETGKWYRIYAEGCKAANGERTYADFCLGTEKKLIVFFQGGGVSYNEYTAARPSSLYSRNMEEGFYMIHVDLFSDLSVGKGILENSERNPFLIMIPSGVTAMFSTLLSVECADYAEYIIGRNMTAITNSLYGLTQKGASAIGGAIPGLLLIAVGYSVNEATGAYAGDLATLPDMVNGLSLVLALVPACFALASFLIYKFG